MSAPWSLRTLAADGMGVDRAIAALLGARRGETVSQLAGAGAAAGRWRWCVLCRVLAVLVERDHCARAIDPAAGPTATGPVLRSGVLLFGVLGLAWVLLGLLPAWLLLRG